MFEVGKTYQINPGYKMWGATQILIVKLTKTGRYTIELQDANGNRVVSRTTWTANYLNGIITPETVNTPAKPVKVKGAGSKVATVASDDKVFVAFHNCGTIAEYRVNGKRKFENVRP
jgi:hypothetical protein